MTVTLGIDNASFVAQSVDWIAPHVAATIKAAHRHQGLSFVRILQRCPHFMPQNFAHLQGEAPAVRLLLHDDGIPVDERTRRQHANHHVHDPKDLNAARALAADPDHTALGLLYRSDSMHCYDEVTSAGLGMGAAEKVAAVQAEIDRYLL